MSIPDIFDLDAFLEDWSSQSTGDDRQCAIEYLSGHVPRYVLGRNPISLLLANALNLDGVLDDYAEPGQWKGLPVIKADDLAANGIIVNSVLMARPVSAAKRLQSLPTGTRTLNYCELLRAAPEHVPLPPFVRESRDALRAHPDDFRRLHALFADSTSRRTFEDVLRYRVTADPQFMREYRLRVTEQYFEDFCEVEPGAVFIDAGGYHGETSIEFVHRYPTYGRIHVFEPAPANYALCCSELKDIRNVTVHPTGLSDSIATLGFTADAGSASQISDEGGETISVAPLDDLVTGPVNFIKMDLEGWELQALKGARNAIIRNHPILAISAYHHPLDFIRIHAWVCAQRDDYDVYLRHYTEGWIETVLYFIPKHQTNTSKQAETALKSFSIADLHAEICRRRGDVVNFGRAQLAVSAELGGALYHTDGAWLDFHNPVFKEIQATLNPHLVLDIGANMGFSSVCYGQHFPNARIIAIEPNPALTELYHRNMQLNHIEHYELQVKCAGDTNTTLTFSCPKGFSVDAQVASAASNTIPSAFQAEQITLDQLLAGIDGKTTVFIKIDAQGYDFNIMKGGADFFARHKHYMVRIEFAPAWLEQQDTDPSAFLAWMIERFDVVELPSLSFEKEPLKSLFQKALRVPDAPSFVAYTKGRSRNGKGHIDLLLKPRSMAL